jgi:hypothetical protein
MNMRRFTIRVAVLLWGLPLAMNAAPALAQPVQLVRGCLVETIAALRLRELAQTIALCDQIIDDAAAPRELRGQALGQRGLLHAKRWSIVETAQDANQGIADITEALRFHTPEKARKHHFLIIRGQLYLATAQLKRAADDFKTVLAEAPDNDAARAGLRKIGTLENY